MSNPMKAPNDILLELNKKFNRHKGLILTEALTGINISVLPIDVPISNLSEKAVLDIGLDHLIEWSTLWHNSSLWPHVNTKIKNWKFGKQDIPERLVISNIKDFLVETGNTKIFSEVSIKAQFLIVRHPILISVVSKHWDYLCYESDFDIRLMCDVLAWFLENRESGLYERQIPIIGLHTKWLEKRRKTIKSFLRALLSSDLDDYYLLTGIKKPPHRIRIRILCGELRNKVGGLCDIESPLTELSNLPIAPSRIVIMENLVTGLALEDMKDTVVIFRLGYSVREVAKLNWVKSVKQIYYWGDLDTNGMNMLGLLRTRLPIISILMDKKTIDRNLNFLSVEKKIKKINLEFQFTPSELEAYEYLITLSKNKKPNRLEQEFVPWESVLSSLSSSIDDSFNLTQYIHV